MGANDSPYPTGGGTGTTPAGSSTTGATVDIWGLGDYGKTKITIGEAHTNGGGFGGYYKLPAEDREGRPGGSLAPGTQGPVAPGVPGAARPTYGDGSAVVISADDVMATYANMAYASPKGKAELIKMQQALFRAGYYGSAKPSDIAFGSWNSSVDAPAFRDAIKSMVDAERKKPTGLTFEEFVNNTGDSRDKSAKENAGPGQQHAFTNPRVIASVLQQTAQTVLGRNLSKDEVDHFVSDYTATENEYFKTLDHPENGNTFQPPSVETAALDTLQQDHAGEAGGNRASDYLGVLQGLLGMGSGSLPTPNSTGLPAVAGG